jgi:hypothetical protein
MAVWTAPEREFQGNQRQKTQPETGRTPKIEELSFHFHAGI